MKTAPTMIQRAGHSPLTTLAFLAAVTEGAYLLVAVWGQSLHVEGDGTHSLLAILGLFAVAFVCYLLAIRAALVAEQGRCLIVLIATAAVIFRLTLLFSNPIEEVDLYRYLWDGQATIAGVSPFRYSPQQILRTDSDEEPPADLARLITVKQTVSAMPEILDRVHYGELPTIYPPTSQAIFAVATLCTPPSASVTVRLIVMKAWFVLFDLATIPLVIWLLRWIGKPIGWVVAYAWCPLLIKEVANSGHLDALAVFLSTAAFYLACRAMFPKSDGDGIDAKGTVANQHFSRGDPVCAGYRSQVLSSCLDASACRHGLPQTWLANCSYRILSGCNYDFFCSLANVAEHATGHFAAVALEINVG